MRHIRLWLAPENPSGVLSPMRPVTACYLAKESPILGIEWCPLQVMCCVTLRVICTFLGCSCFPFTQFHVSGKQLKLYDLYVIIQGWVSHHGHPSSVSLIFYSFILIISSRPFITATLKRICEILKVFLVNGQIFSAALYSGKRQSINACCINPQMQGIHLAW